MNSDRTPKKTKTSKTHGAPKKPKKFGKEWSLLNTPLKTLAQREEPQCPPAPVKPKTPQNVIGFLNITMIPRKLFSEPLKTVQEEPEYPTSFF